MMSTDAFSDPNELERALMEAAKDPTARGEFTRVLLESDVYVVGARDASAPAGGDDRLETGERVSIRGATLDDGRECLPFYSSERVLAASIADEVTFLRLRARDLFEMTRGATLMLNFGAVWGKEFTAREIDQLLDHGWAGDQITTDRPREVRLGLPADEPTALMAGITTVLKRHPQIAAAYLGLIQFKDDPGTPGATEPHLIIGVEGTGSGDPRGAVPDIGPVAAELAPGQPTDFVIVEEGDEGVAGWLRTEGLKFYEKP